MGIFDRLRRAKKKAKTICIISGKHTDVSKIDEIRGSIERFANKKGEIVNIVDLPVTDEELTDEKLNKIKQKIEQGIRFSTPEECEVMGNLLLTEYLYKKLDTPEFIKSTEKALLFYEAALTMDPNRFISLVNKGVCLSRLSRFEEALVCYEDAIKLNSESFEAWTNKGNCLMMLSNPRKALNCYDKALKLNPKDEYVNRLRKFCFENLHARRMYVPAKNFDK